MMFSDELIFKSCDNLMLTLYTRIALIAHCLLLGKGFVSGKISVNVNDHIGKDCVQAREYSSPRTLITWRF